jgi:hypothetical protein
MADLHDVVDMGDTLPISENTVNEGNQIGFSRQRHPKHQNHPSVKPQIVLHDTIGTLSAIKIDTFKLLEGVGPGFEP